MPRYIRKLPRGFTDAYATKLVPWGPVGYVVFKRTYSRFMEHLGRTEEWFETVDRCVNGILSLKGKFTEHEATQLYDHVFNFRMCFSGRSLWQLGTPNMERIGADSLQNCFSGETEILTREGIKSFIDCNSTEELWVKTPTGYEWVKSDIKSFGNQPMLEVEFSNDTTVLATPDHQWLDAFQPFTDYRIPTKELNGVRVPSDDGCSKEVIDVRETGTTAIAWCAQVPEHHNFTLGNGVVTGNCWAVSVKDPIDPFCFTFNQLMLGGGVGFNITPEEVYGLPTVEFAPDVKHVDTFDADFIVPDNREGWVKLLGRILKAHFFTNQRLHFCTKGIRSRGELINTFGGTASGDMDLVWGMSEIVRILQGARGRKLRPVECLDIMNIIGKIVVSGNVRRSAQIALGDPRDLEYMSAKNWTTGKVPAWRGMSNNSVQCDDIDVLPESFWSGYNGDGEPYGFVNLGLCRSHGRLIDGPNYRPDPDVIGTNPCAEIALAHKEPCNLMEQFVCRMTDLDTWKEVAALSYKVAKTISIWPFSDPDTNDIVQMNHRLGIGCTGIQQATWWGPKHYDAVYRHMEQADEVYSRQMDVKTSNKLSTGKPSGTLSLLAEYKGGVLTPGVNDGYSGYHNRRISFAAEDTIVDVARASGFHVEPKREIDGSENYSTMVVTFPVKQVGGKSTSAIHQLKRHRMFQTYWSDNAVSTTVYYQREELDGIKKYLRDNIKDKIKSVSFLLHSDHGFDQAPLEAISKDQYEEAQSKTNQITKLHDQVEVDLVSGVECAGGSCPVK